jgi:hypothetical protein
VDLVKKQTIVWHDDTQTTFDVYASEEMLDEVKECRSILIEAVC